MKMLLSMAMALLVANGSPEDTHQTASINSIEEQLKMPKGANTIAHYSRFYAKLETGEVRAVFIEGAYDGLRVGQRRWLADAKLLPVVFDGGCYVVTVLFDPRAGTVKQASCNGVA